MLNQQAAPITAQQVVEEIFDLLCRRLPEVDRSDPARPHLAVLVPALGQALGRPPVSLATDRMDAKEDVA